MHHPDNLRTRTTPLEQPVKNANADHVKTIPRPEYDRDALRFLSVILPP